MDHAKDQLLAAIERRSIQRVGRLAGEMIRARPQEKEAILAERDFCLWLAETCNECLQQVGGFGPLSGSESGSAAPQ